MAKCLSAQYLKEDYAGHILESHLAQRCQGITKESFILIDEMDICKKYVKYMEGLDFVRNRDTRTIGPGYNHYNRIIIFRPKK